MTFIPAGDVFLTLIIVPSLAGLLCGLTGSGSAIVVQVFFRIFQTLLGLSLADNDSDSSRRILAIAAVLSLSQYPVAVWGLWKSKERHIRWDAVALLFPGLNIMVWVGTFIAMHWPPGVLLYILGVTLICIACWQFIYQSIIGRKVDDESVKVNYRTKLNQKHQLALTNNNQPGNGGNTTAISYPSGEHSNNDNDQTTHHNHYHTPGTNLADLGDVAPNKPRVLKAPNPSFDLTAYSNKNGLNLTLPQPGLKMKLSYVNAPDRPYDHIGSIDNALKIDSAGDDDDFAAISIDDSHKLHDGRPLWRRVMEDIINNPKLSLLGLAAGILAGLLGGMMGINGPPVILFLLSLKLNGSQLRDTSILIFFSNLPCLLLARLIFSVFHLNEWLIYLVAVVSSTAGLFLGTALHKYTNTRMIMTSLQFIILLSSITLTKPGTTTVTAGIFLGIYILIALCILGFVGWRMARNRLIRENAKQQFYTLVEQ